MFWGFFFLLFGDVCEHKAGSLKTLNMPPLLKRSRYVEMERSGTERNGTEWNGGFTHVRFNKLTKPAFPKLASG